MYFGKLKSGHLYKWTNPDRIKLDLIEINKTELDLFNFNTTLLFERLDPKINKSKLNLIVDEYNPLIFLLLEFKQFMHYKVLLLKVIADSKIGWFWIFEELFSNIEEIIEE